MPVARPETITPRRSDQELPDQRLDQLRLRGIEEIVDDIQAALNEFAAVAEALEAAKSARQKETT
ncbi:MAG: hypothetical protein WCB73_02245 [Pseudonocardiaceae bacterium]